MTKLGIIGAMAVEVETPEEYLGFVMGDIPSRRGLLSLAVAPILALGSVVYFLATLLIP